MTYVLLINGVVKKDNLPANATAYCLSVAEALREGSDLWTVAGLRRRWELS